MFASPERSLLGDHDAMEVLNSRVLLRPTDRAQPGLLPRHAGAGDLPRVRGWAGAGHGLLPGRRVPGAVGRAAEPPAPGMALWLQVRDLAATRQELGKRGVDPASRGGSRGDCWRWIADPDGLRICIVEVPAEHPLRRRADWVRRLAAAGAAQVEIEEYLRRPPAATTTTWAAHHVLGRLAVATTSIRHGQLTAPALRLGWCVQPADDGRTGVVEALRAVVEGSCAATAG